MLRERDSKKQSVISTELDSIAIFCKIEEMDQREFIECCLVIVYDKAYLNGMTWAAENQ